MEEKTRLSRQFAMLLSRHYYRLLLSSSRLLLLSLLLLGLLPECVRAQDDFGGDDSSSDTLDDSALGLGGESDSMSEDGREGGRRGSYEKLTYIEQTALALQQLAIVIGVAFMVGFLFMGMIAIEKVWEYLETKYKEHFGELEEDEEDPAALVGTFKRYKN